MKLKKNARTIDIGKEFGKKIIKKRLENTLLKNEKASKVKNFHLC